ncbi:MurR/RpiR family transcriptional regulator [Sporosarcina sp. BI001-red]|uniref:MurR/RpiR family transcriptional regulator n=1 Tax=Sporosarcina sp. BI001-red TaxID=2282866 RepID=UPI000E274F2B|nr:MurR/RpiR family transcriptional regulator [Sporosarcina sp. BI001-red]REB05563.1 MurR/RpiR family transcriptional regulator [Sporosarcina sp. BI001-red]
MQTGALKGMKPSVIMEQYKPQFTKSEHKIYTYLTANVTQVIYLSLTELCEASGVAEATVLRFFRKLGYKGFQDFKYSYAQELAADATVPEHGTYLDKIRSNMVKTVEDSAALVDEKELQRTIEVMKQKDNIVIFGVGSSGIAGLDMQSRLMRIGRQATAVIDPHFQVMLASSLNENSVVIAISISGGTKDIVDSVKIAKEKGATIIVLTNYLKSPLSQYADHILLGSAKENPLDSGSLVSKIAQLFLIDVLCTGLAVKDVEKAEEIQTEISTNISTKLY